MLFYWFENRYHYVGPVVSWDGEMLVTRDEWGRLHRLWAPESCDVIVCPD